MELKEFEELVADCEQILGRPPFPDDLKEFWFKTTTLPESEFHRLLDAYHQLMDRQRTDCT